MNKGYYEFIPYQENQSSLTVFENDKPKDVIIYTPDGGALTTSKVNLGFDLTPDKEIK